MMIFKVVACPVNIDLPPLESIHVAMVAPTKGYNEPLSSADPCAEVVSYERTSDGLTLDLQTLDTELGEVLEVLITDRYETLDGFFYSPHELGIFPKGLIEPGGCGEYD